MPEKPRELNSDTPGNGRPEQATTDSKNIVELATDQPAASAYVSQLETRISEKDDVIGLLKGQLVAKDQQITDLSTRFGNLSDRFAYTQKLLGAMQRMFAPLLGQRDPYAPTDAHDPSDPAATPPVDNQQPTA